MKQIITSLVFLMSAMSLVAQRNHQQTESRLLLPSVEDNCALSHLAVETMEAGDYYLSFWMLPARLTDGSMSSYDVYVNNSKVGTITPTKANWQSISLDNSQRVTLQKGVSIISVAGKNREAPLVEDVKLGKTISESSFSSDAYESYLRQASLPSLSGEALMTTQRVSSTQQDEAQRLELMSKYGVGRADVFPNVPVLYSFHMTKEYEKGETISVTTTSATPHFIDVFYVNSKPIKFFSTPFYSRALSKSIVEEEISSGSRKDLVFPSRRIADCDQLTQRLGWLAISERAKNASYHIAHKTVTVPKDGLYFIKVRRQTDGKAGVADVIIDNRYFYENQPIATSHRDAVMPRGQERAAMTLKVVDDTEKNRNCDPWIFIEGAGGNRVVAYDDDATDDQRRLYGVKRDDAVIEMTYDMPTTGVHLMSYSTQTPKFTCHIITNMDPQKDEELIFQKKTTEGEALCSMIDITINGNNLLVEKEEQMTLEALQVMDVNGFTKLTSACNVSEEESLCQVDISSLRRDNPAVYYVVIYTDLGVCTKKISL